MRCLLVGADATCQDSGLLRGLVGCLEAVGHWGGIHVEVMVLPRTSMGLPTVRMRLQGS